MTWFMEVQDLLAYFPNGRCKGFDVNALNADALMAGRDIKPDTYNALRHLGRCIAIEINERQSTS